jgi:carboxylate-amine ligase
MAQQDVRSVGVEEEFLLVRGPVSRLSTQGDDVVERADELDEDAQFEHEFKRAQAELASPPTRSLPDLLAELRRLRAEMATAARREGERLVATASSPLRDRPKTTDDERYQRMNVQFGMLAREQLTCGMHVHVSVEPDEGIAAIDGIRPWLALLTALSSNSPLHRGRDTGYASYRTVLWGQWPTAGPTARFRDADEYDRLVRDLVTVGAAADDAMIYFDARLSRNYPTVEIRVCDVCARAEDAVVIAALCRALVETAVRRGGDGLARPRPELLRGTSWRAARYGMADELADVTGSPARLRPAWDVVDALLEHVSPALDGAGDGAAVSDGLRRIRQRGTGAELQRSAFTEGGVEAALSAVTVRAPS